MKKILFGILLAAALGACNFKSTSLEKVWLYTHSSSAASTRDTLLTPASFLLLNEDGSYTKDFGAFEYGAWERQEMQLMLTNQQGQTSILEFTPTGKKELQLRAKNGSIANFESQRLPASENNPFSKENNAWRIRAAKKETDKEIRSRLLNHCRFWETYFTWALDNELSSIDVRSTPTLIKIYGNGFAIKPFDELPASWKAYFFDEEDCRKANEQLTAIFQQQNIAWPRTQNKYKMFIGAFQQLQQYLQ